MLDFPLMLRMKLPVVERIHPQRNKFATGVENKARGDSKLNHSPALNQGSYLCLFKSFTEKITSW